ncbi:MAG: hypothetical protein AAGJ35_03225 [Myxococcota bacterium]
MNKTQARFYFKLSRQSHLPASQIPRTIATDNTFQQLKESGIITIEPKAAGNILVIANPNQYQQFLQLHFPNGDPTHTQPRNTIESHHHYNNSKSARSKSQTPIIFLRGNHTIQLNGQHIDLSYPIQHFQLFATVLQTLRTPKLCFIENKEPFLRAEAVIPQAYTYLHTYGRIGKNVLKKLQVDELLVFSDYDYVGLNEYLTCKEHIQHTTFYLPSNYDTLFRRHARDLKPRKTGQKLIQKVKASNDPTVCRLRTQIESTNKFLEQEALFHHAL